MVATVFSLPDLAVHLGCREAHLRKLCNQNRVPHTRAGSRRVFLLTDMPEIRKALEDAGCLPKAVLASAPV